VKALELIEVDKSFKKRRGQVVRALDGVSLEVGKGEVVGILGPNGSGKSTLVRVISTLVVPDSGMIEVFGTDAVRHPKQVQRSMNRVSVEASFFKKLSAMEHLSRGMQQKIALARALLTSPVLMLLDEPTTGLDPRSKKDVQAFIRRIRDAHDSSILLCTHDMGEAEELCDRVGIMMDGKILALDESEELKRRYAGGANGRV